MTKPITFSVGDKVRIKSQHIYFIYKPDELLTIEAIWHQETHATWGIKYYTLNKSSVRQIMYHIDLMPEDTTSYNLKHRAQLAEQRGHLIIQ